LVKSREAVKNHRGVVLNAAKNRIRAPRAT